MIIDKIELENIRSYKKESITFKKDINFLTGDIGCGKSSILQAIEFALFGFKRGDLEGYHLLRKGETKGSIKLTLRNNNNPKSENEKEDKSIEFENKNTIEIARFIKKSKSGNISQENGHIIINNNLIELSPQELNAQIFQILHFPQEFLTKDKNLIYRFTIYTRQDQLKEVLAIPADKRLEIIRKIFNIDKYKNLNEGISIYLSKLRDKKKIYSIRIEPIKEIERDIKEIAKENKEQKIKVLKINSKKKEFESKLTLYENAIKKRELLTQKNNKESILIEKQLTQIENNEKDIRNIDEKIKENTKIIILSKKENFSEKIKTNLKEIEKEDNNLKNIDNIKKEINNKLKNYQKKEEEKEKIENQILNIKNLINQYNTLKKNNNHLLTKCQLKDLENEISKSSTKIQKIDKKEESILKLRENISLFKLKEDTLNEKIEIRLKKIENINTIKTCENCLQDVKKDHKDIIKSNIKTEIKIMKKELSELIITNKKEKNQLKKEEEIFDKLIEIKNELIVKKERYNSIKEKEEKERIEKNIMSKLDDEIKKGDLFKLERNKETLKKDIENLNNQRKEYEKLNTQEININKKISSLNIENSKIENTQKELHNIEKESQLLEKEKELKLKLISNKSSVLDEKNKLVINLKKINDEKNKLMTNLGKINENLRLISMKISTIEGKIEYNEENSIKKTEELNKLKIINEKYNKILEDENFLANIVVNVSYEIEKIIFSKYYEEFSYEFENIFKELIEDNDIDVRLDSEFTPIIEQNGYETEIKNLSGGEKSSLAIAYRLGLKKIIESNLEKKQKLSLLILDEPTQGFSDNQIVRLGNLLKQSQLEQIILVSHDEKIESISESVINIEKENHISKIIE